MKTRWFFAAPGAAAIMLFAACSDADNTSANPAVSAAASPADAVLVSLQHSTDSRTVQVELSATVNNIPVIGSQPVTGNGAVDFDAKLAQAHFDVLGVGVDAVSDGTSAYARSPIFGDASWYEIDFEGAKPGLGDSLGTIWGRLFDPTQLFASLRDASSSMTEVGHDEVNGVDTIHYQGNIIVTPQSDGAPAVPLDVWVDGQGLVARIKTSMDLGGDGGQDGVSADLTVDFHDYGQPVTITVPSGSDVKAFADVAGAFGRDSSGSRTP